MNSPFPGMDPYLEDAELWRGFHNFLIGSMVRLMNADLPRGYAANIEEHVLIQPERGEVYPDIFVTSKSLPPVLAQTGGTALIDAPQAVEIVAPIEVYYNEPNQRYLKIVTGANWKEVVAIIEVLSPTNKRRGPDQEAYLQKQQEIIGSRTHLLEIDLLRKGAHTVAAPYERQRRAGNIPYLISLSRNGRRVPLDVWPVSLRTPLPRIALPLKSGDPDFALDLQSAFERAYESGPYARSINYALPPAVPLDGEDAAWADALLREKGLRGTVSVDSAAQT